MTELTEDAQRFIDRFKWAYYETGKNTRMGQLALGRCAFSVAGEFSGDYESLDPSTIADIALQSLLKAPAPDKSAEYYPLKQPGLEIMATAMEHNMPVYIWTVGDTGPYRDPENNIDDPAYDYQKVKIHISEMKERIAEIMEGDMPVEFAINTSAVSKESALDDILTEAEDNDTQEVFIADDLYPNELIVQKMAAKHPKLKIYFWLVKKDNDPAGNIAAYRDHVIPILNKNAVAGIKTAVVFDLDDTLFDTQASLVRAAVLTQAELDKLAQSTPTS